MTNPDPQTPPPGPQPDPTPPTGLDQTQPGPLVRRSTGSPPAGPAPSGASRPGGYSTAGSIAAGGLQIPLAVVIAAGAALVLVLLALVVLFLPPFRLAASLAGDNRLSESNPTITGPDGISVTWVDGASLKLSLGALSADQFTTGAGKAPEGARESVPAGLTLVSPFYTIDAEGGALTIVEVALPDGADPVTLDLYAWDAESGQWVFVPSTVDESAGVVRTSARPAALALFSAGSRTPVVGVTIEVGEVLDPAVGDAANLVLPRGVILDADGTLTGEFAGGWEEAAGYAVLPLIAVKDGAVLNDLLNNPASLALHVDDMRRLAEESRFNGVAVDYAPLEPGDRQVFTAFIEDLAEEIHSSGQMLAVVAPLEATDPDAEAGGFDLAAIGEAADLVIVTLPEDPTAYGIEGEAIARLDRAADAVSRYKLLALLPGASYDATAAEPISYAEAVDALGEVELLNDSATTYPAGTELEFGLSGDVTSFSADNDTRAYAYTVASGDAPRDLWAVTAATIRERLNQAKTRNLGGMVVTDIGLMGEDSGLDQALAAFKVNAQGGVPAQFAIQWQVTGSSGASFSEVTAPGTPWAWLADAPGSYTVQGSLLGARTSERGAVAVTIGDADEVAEVTETPEPTTPAATLAPGVTPTAGPSPTPAPTATPQPNTNAPAPVAAGGSDGGGFELGGQVPGYIGHPDYMHAAGMSWVKFQQKWSPGMDPSAVAGMIAAGHANGFKVLLSIAGPAYPSSIDYASYVSFLGGVAAYGPDAIEIWNEMNLYTEWPRGQYSPTDYVNNMLAPGFNAIKSVSPGTMVIIGALAPTGVDDMDIAMADYRYLQGLAAAGAARYANCIGAHHNAGATSPSATTGHPADAGGGHHSWYFRPTIDLYYSTMGGALPVCLTEFGYVSGEGYGELPSNWSWGSAITVADQAAWLHEGAGIARGLGYVRLMIIWNVDFTYWGNDPQAGYAIVRPDGTCPACDLLP